MPSMAVDTLKVKKQADSLYKEGVTAIGSGQYAKAIVVLQNALKENEKIGNSANTLIAIGYVYIQTKNCIEEASQEFAVLMYGQYGYGNRLDFSSGAVCKVINIYSNPND